MLNIRGVIPAMVIPMNPDESVNESELRNQVRRQIAAGVHGLFVFGTNGEFYALSEAEKLRVLEITVDENHGRLPVYAGTGCPILLIQSACLKSAKKSELTCCR